MGPGTQTGQPIYGAGDTDRSGHIWGRGHRQVSPYMGPGTQTGAAIYGAGDTDRCGHISGRGHLGPTQTGAAIYRPSNILVYLRDGSAEKNLHAATMSLKLQIKLSISPSPSTDPMRPGAWQGSHWSANF